MVSIIPEIFHKQWFTGIVDFTNILNRFGLTQKSLIAVGISQSRDAQSKYKMKQNGLMIAAFRKIYHLYIGVIDLVHGEFNESSFG